jgi:hypothetical protein
MDRLKMGLQIHAPITDFDPQQVQITADAYLARNLYSRLVNLDDDGNLESEIATSFNWTGGSFKVTIREGLKTVDGHLITAEDVYLSLLRIVRNNRSTHGDLRSILCPNFNPSTGQCAGLSHDQTSVTITPVNRSMQSFLMQLFASVDFSIIPKGSLDMTDPLWPIKEYRNTSGLYFVDQSLGNNGLLMKLNPNHHRSSPLLFPEIEAIPIDSGEGNLEAFKTGQIDFIPTTAGLRASDFTALTEGATLHKSHPIHITFLAFSSSARNRWTPAQRGALARRIREVVLSVVKSPDIQPVDQFFPRASEGSLTQSQSQVLSLALSSHQEGQFPTGPIRIVVSSSLYKDLEPAFALIPEVTFERLKALPWKQPRSSQPDGFIVAGDTSFYESLSLVHYYFSVGVFGEADDDRLDLLRELHLHVLKNVNVAPIYATSYAALAREPIRMAFSPFYAGSPPWKMFRK